MSVEDEQAEAVIEMLVGLVSCRGCGRRIERDSDEMPLCFWCWLDANNPVEQFHVFRINEDGYRPLLFATHRPIRAKGTNE